ncbi:hypothetical protein HS125_05480 [bacterium]|nr:hypothetical protein [bacterium]
MLLIVWPILLLEVFAPGWLLLRGLSSWDEDDCMALAIPTGALAMGLLGLAGLWLQWEADAAAWIALGAPLALGLVAAGLRRRSLLPASRDHRRLLVAWFAATSLFLALQTRVAAYIGGGWYNDWLLSYQISWWYGEHGKPDAVFFEVYSPISRPPLFYILNGLEMARWFGLFDLYQWSATVWNSAILWGAWVWIRRHGSTLLSIKGWRPAGTLAALVLTPAVALNVLIPGCWRCGLLALHYSALEEGLRCDECLAPLGVAYFTHQLTLAYLAGAGFYLIVSRWRKLSRRRLTEATIGLVLALSVSLPWWAWSIENYGLAKTLTTTPVLTRAVDKTGYDMLVTRGYNFAGLWLPENTRRILTGRLLEPSSALPRWTEAMQAVWRGTLWGNLGLATLAMLVWLALRRRLRPVDLWPGWGFVVFVVVFAVAVQPLRERGGLSQVALLPLAVILFLWTAQVFSVAFSRRGLFAWLALLAVEFLIACPLWVYQVREQAFADRLQLRTDIVAFFQRPDADLLGVATLAAAVSLLLALFITSRQKGVDKRDQDGILTG